MNKRIDFSNIGGFPVTQETFNWMQESYRGAFAGLAGLIGSKAIISGVEVVAGSVSNGWICYNGELLPFVGGQLAADSTVNIVETAGEPVVFEDNAERLVYFERVARLGSGGAFPFTDLKRPDAIRNIWLPGDVKTVMCTLEYFQENFDQSGLGRNERAGWAWMNGENGTVDMGGRVFIGYDADDLDFMTIKGLVGSKNVTIQKTNLPQVKIDVPIPTTDTSTGEDGSGKITMGNEGGEPVNGPTLKTAFLGDGVPLKVIPAGVISIFIQKL